MVIIRDGSNTGRTWHKPRASSGAPGWALVHLAALVRSMRRTTSHGLASRYDTGAPPLAIDCDGLRPFDEVTRRE